MGNRVWALMGWYQPAPARHWARTTWGLPGNRIREIQDSGLSSRMQVPCPGKGSRSSLSLRCRRVSECRHPEGRWRMREKGKRWGRRLCAGARSAAHGCPGPAEGGGTALCRGGAAGLWQPRQQVQQAAFVQSPQGAPAQALGCCGRVKWDSSCLAFRGPIWLKYW